MKLSAYRKNKYTQKGLADKLGVSRSTLAMWETDKTQPDIQSIIKICEILNISADDLLEIPKNHPPIINNKKLDNDEIRLIIKFREYTDSLKKFILHAMDID